MRRWGLRLCSAAFQGGTSSAVLRYAVHRAGRRVVLRPARSNPTTAGQPAVRYQGVTSALPAARRCEAGREAACCACCAAYTLSTVSSLRCVAAREVACGVEGRGWQEWWVRGCRAGMRAQAGGCCVLGTHAHHQRPPRQMSAVTPSSAACKNTKATPKPHTPG